MKALSILPSLRSPVLGQTWQSKYLQSMGIISKNLNEKPLDKQVATLSGGKDSTLTLFLIRKALEIVGKDPSGIKVLFENTGVEYPETIKFIRKLTEEWNIDLIETKPEKTFWQCIDEYGYPRPKSNRTQQKGKKNKRPLCCDYLKEKPAKKVMKEYGFEVVYLGITAMESHQRQIRAVTHGTCYFAIADKMKKVHPILYWTEQEVWDFIKLENIPWNPIYKKVDRCGCMPCTAFKLWKENLQATYPKMYEKIMRGMGQELIT